MKKTVFWVITILFPFILLLLLEAGLRIGGYNEEGNHLFREVPGQPQYLAPNPAFVGRYFPSFVPQIAPATFMKRKPSDTFRVFVFGGSSTQGFPYNFYQSFSSRIEKNLIMETQGLQIEVINLGMTAVNSYVIWDMSRRIMEYEPDAVVIYAGHNEYYGSFGVGSSQFGLGKSIGLKRLILRLKNLALYQLFENILSAEDKAPEKRTMMARAVRDADIEKGSDLYKAGLDQFRQNMSDVAEYFNKKEIPVFIGTVTSNLKDQPPLGENAAARNAFEKGGKLYSEGKTDSALAEFTLAKELDEIRFRAPGAVNDIIRDIAGEFDARLVEVEKLSIDSSSSGIPDDSFFIDHLHPDWASHELIGDLFFEEIKKLEVIKESYLPNPLFTDIPIPLFEKTFSEIPVKRLTSGYPFKKGLTESEEYAAFQREFDRYVERSYVDSVAATAWRNQRDIALALTDAINYGVRNRDSSLVANHYLSMAHWQVFNDNLLKKGVDYSIQNRSLDAYTVQLLHLILRKHRSDEYFANTLAALYLIHQDLERSEYWLKEAEKINPDSPDLWYNFARFYVLKKDTVKAREYFQKYISTRNSN